MMLRIAAAVLLTAMIGTAYAGPDENSAPAQKSTNGADANPSSSASHETGGFELGAFPGGGASVDIRSGGKRPQRKQVGSAALFGLSGPGKERDLEKAGGK